MAHEQAGPSGAESSSGVVHAGRVQLSSEPAYVGIPGHEAPATPRVELVRSGDIVQALDVTCSCGQRFRVHCVYS